MSDSADSLPGNTAPGAYGLVANPELTSSNFRNPRKAVPDEQQAKGIVGQLVQSNRRRHTISARILGKLNAERPYDHTKLEQEGLAWKHNFSTKPLAAIVDRVSPRFVDVVNSVKYLTSAQLPSKYANATGKTEAFRDGFTKLVRARREWRGILDMLALDDVLFGYTVVGWLDEFGWFPDHFRFDHLFLPDGTKQQANTCQVVMVREDYLPHELYEKIRDREAARAAGWNIEATIKAINEASPQNARSALTNGGTIEIWYQNAERELTLGTSYTTGASSIVVYSLLVREVNGKVSHYRLSEPARDVIFSRDDRFEQMDDVFTFFSFQIGNMTMLGSKGIGRDLYDLAAAQDRGRNEICDRLWMSGKTLVQGDPRQIHKFSMSVVGSMCIIPNGWQMLEQKVDGNVEPFLKLDAFFQQLMDNLVGSVSPRFLQGERVTKAQVDLFAAREEESRDSRVGRFLSQIIDMVSTMQRRACDPACEEQDAKDFRKAMLEEMTEEELNLLATYPVAGVVEDLTPVQRQQLVTLCAEKRGHPLYNQRELELADISARLGADMADRLLLPDNDPTEQAEQMRLQQLELVLLTSGQPVPVSPRDSHLIHIETLMPALQQLGQVATTPEGTPILEVAIAHLNEHYSSAVNAGVPPEKLAETKAFLTKAGKLLADLKAHDEQAQKLVAAGDAVDADHAQAPDSGVPLIQPASTSMALPAPAAQ